MTAITGEMKSCSACGRPCLPVSTSEDEYLCKHCAKVTYDMKPCPRCGSWERPSNFKKVGKFHLCTECAFHTSLCDKCWKRLGYHIYPAKLDNGKIALLCGDCARELMQDRKEARHDTD